MITHGVSPGRDIFIFLQCQTPFDAIQTCLSGALGVKTALASLYHQFWACPQVARFWDRIYKCLSDIYGIINSLSPCTTLLGVLPIDCPITGVQRGAVALATLLARRVILNWKSSASPPLRHWVKDLLMSLGLEKIRFLLPGKCDFFAKNGDPTLEG